MALSAVWAMVGGVTRCLDCRAKIARGSRCPSCQRARQRAKTAERGGWGRKTSRERVLLRDANTCQRCHRVFGPADLIADHIVALTNGGADTDENKQALCKRCSVAKTKEDMRTRGVGRISRAGPAPNTRTT